jgi:hypothetical protein
MIEPLEESEKRRMRECAPQAKADFADSVLAIYGIAEAADALPEHIGSCLLLDIDGTLGISSAAHIADMRKKGMTLFVAGPIRSQILPVFGAGFITTPPPRGDRNLDPLDCAFWRVPDHVIEDLGAANFLGPSRLSHNRAAMERRYYTALGYAVSRNDACIDHVRGSIAVTASTYTNNAVSEPALARKLRVSGDEHIFMRYSKQAEDTDGVPMKTLYPQGFSGGALLDLGDFTSPAIYAGGTKGRARLAGMIIEYHEKYRALVAVKIGPIVTWIRNALGRAHA